MLHKSQQGQAGGLPCTNKSHKWALPLGFSLEASSSFLSWVLEAYFHCWAPSLALHGHLPCPTVSGWKSILVKWQWGDQLIPICPDSFSFKTESPVSQEPPRSWADGGSGSHWEAGPYRPLFLGNVGVSSWAECKQRSLGKSLPL